MNYITWIKILSRSIPELREKETPYVKESSLEVLTEEVQSAVKNSKISKATGNDEVTVKLSKYAGRGHGKYLLHQVFYWPIIFLPYITYSQNSSI